MLQVCTLQSLADVLTALQHLYRHAAEPASELAYAAAQPLRPVLEAACERASALLVKQSMQDQVLLL